MREQKINNTCYMNANIISNLNTTITLYLTKMEINKTIKMEIVKWIFQTQPERHCLIALDLVQTKPIVTKQCIQNSSMQTQRLHPCRGKIN